MSRIARLTRTGGDQGSDARRLTRSPWRTACSMALRTVGWLMLSLRARPSSLSSRVPGEVALLDRARKRDGELEVQRHRTRRIERAPVEDDLDDIVRLRLRPLDW